MSKVEGGWPGALRAIARATRWRAVLPVAVFFAALAGFALGGTVSQRPMVAAEPLVAKVYYALGLFVLAGIDLGMPSGGPTIARSLLWFSFFAAPTVTAGAITEGLLRLLDQDVLARRRLRGHVVIAGCGRLAMLYLTQLRARAPSVPVLIVEPRVDHPNLALARARGARVILGDITDDAILTQLSLERASRALMLTGDDFANLDAATKVLARVPAMGERLIVHVGDLRFAQAIAETRVARACALFNSYEVAARHLVETVLIPHIRTTAGCDAIVLGGFGRFGQTVLSELRRHGAECVRTVVVISSDATRSMAEFGEHEGGQPAGEVTVIDGDLSDPRVWAAARKRCEEHHPAFVLASDDAGANLRTALWLSRTFEGSLVVARGFGASAFAQELSRERGIVTLDVGALLTESLPERWLPGAGERDS
jgi:voltage-gated potassium channel Kch